MTGDTTALTDYFKRNYDVGSPLFAAQQNLKAASWSRFKPGSIKPSPQGVFIPVMMRGNESVRAYNETEGNVDPQDPLPVQATILTKEIRANFELTGRSIALSKTDSVAFAYTLDATMKDTLSRLMSSCNRQVLGTGTGQITLVDGAVVASTSIVVDNPFLLRANMYIDAWTAVGGTKEASRVKITNINFSTRTITVDTAVTLTDNDLIVMSGVLDNAPTEGKEISGLQRICDTTTLGTSFEGISASTYSEWQGNVIDAGAVPVSQDLLQRIANRVSWVGDSSPDLLMSAYGQARNFLNTELNKVRYEPAKVEGGHTVLKWNDLTWMIEKDYPLNEVGMYNTEYIERMQIDEPRLASYTGNQLYQKTGFNAIAGYYIWYGNLFTRKRNAHGRLINLTEPTF